MATVLGSLYNLLVGDGDDKIVMKGNAFLQRKYLFDFNDQFAYATDILAELLGHTVELQLVSEEIDPDTQIGKRSKTAHLEGWIFTGIGLTADEGALYSFTFKVDKNFGMPGAILVKNNHLNWFYLSYITLDIPNKPQIQFPCNSWVYNYRHYDGPRIFFRNKACLPCDTPAGLVDLRYAELENLRGSGKGERLRPHRIYDYDVYNDLGDPDKDLELYSRTTLGGSEEFPYPRRCRTGRARTKTDDAYERPVATPELVYVPMDERFVYVKKADFLGSSIRSFAHAIMPAIEIFNERNEEFEHINEIKELYGQEIVSDTSKFEKSNNIPKEEKKLLEANHIFELFRDILTDDNGDASILRFPTPQLIEDNDERWRDDNEFARQLLAGLNPMVIERIKEFPIKSSLDESIYGPAESAITEEHLKPNLDGLSVIEAIEKNRLYILDYHDAYLPYLEKINALKGKSYASRTILFLRDDGTLKLIAIELSLPTSSTKQGYPSKRVFTPPSEPGETNFIWHFVKTHVCINDSGYHQLISHWLRTHAAIEPFIIATHRHLSALHPIHVLLLPHFKNTMNINAIARKMLINAYTGQFLIGGIIERTFSPGRYAMEMSSVVYRSWRFDEQGLPADLIKRGMAVKDPNGTSHGLRLLIEDYPFAVDGLEIWGAIKEWVKDYVSIYYNDDISVQKDLELNRWWAEVKETGHADKKEGWMDLNTPIDLIEILTTLIWVASAHHAAVNFGQYTYAGFMPNRPTMGRKLIPNEDDFDSEDGKLFHSNPHAFYLKMVSNQAQAIIVMATLQILSTHASDEEYLGERNNSLYWTSDQRVLKAFHDFSCNIARINKLVDERNLNPSLKNRWAHDNLPYTLLAPLSDEGLTGRGVPNSTSI